MNLKISFMKSIRNVKIIFSILFLIISCNIFSQQLEFNGTVRDSLTEEPLNFVLIRITNQNDSVIAYSYSDEAGNFKIIMPNGTIGFISASLIGYKTKKSKQSFVFDESVKNGLGVLLSKDITILHDVEITDSSTKVIHKLDRDVHKIPEQTIKESQTIYDILKTLPGVVVDEGTNTIRFKGSSPEILVDNMPAQYIYPDLKQIRINDIEKIELIDKSSIYGGAGGEGGIINIKFKQNKKQETFGMYLGTNNEYAPFNNIYIPNFAILNLNARVGNFFIFNNLFFNDNIYDDETIGKGTLNFQDNLFSRSENSFENTYQWTISDCIGVTYFRNKLRVVIGEQLQFSKFKVIEKLHQITTLDTTYHSEYNQNNTCFNHYFFNRILGRIALDDYKNQDFQLDFNMFNNLLGHPQTNEILTNSDIKQNQIHSTNFDKTMYKSSWDCDLYSLELQYRWRITQRSQINFNARFFHANSPENSKTFFLNDVEHPDLYQFSKFKLNQLPLNIGFAQSFGSFSIDATAKYKFQQFKGNFLRNANAYDTTLNMKYHNFEPSIRLKYHINDANDLYLGYSFSAGEFETNDWSKQIEYYVPFIDKSNPLTWQSGNSDIEMENYHKIYFQYRLSKEKLNFTTELFFNATQNGLAYIKIPITQEIVLNKYDNVATMYRTGLSLSFYGQLAKSWNLDANVQVYHSIAQTNILEKYANLYNVDVEQVKQNNFGVASYFALKYNLKSKIGTKPNITLWGNVFSKEISITGYNKPYFTTSIAFRTNFFKEKLFVSLGLYNFLSPFIKYKSYYDSMGYITNYETNSLNRNMRINLSLGLNLFKGERGTKDFRL